MSALRGGAVLLLIACAALPARASRWSAPADVPRYSALAVPAVGGEAEPELLLAQRAITREWGPSEDSLYAELDVAGWKSEGGALLASAVLPGTGQLYLEEGSGWWFLLAEAGGWVGRHLSDRKADRYRDRSVAFVGDPNDTSSTFSFARLADTPGADVSRLQALWQSDRDGYYAALANDPALQGGFRTAGASGLEGYIDLRDRYDRTVRQSRLVEMLIWANHIASALDALRAARLQNLPLRRDLDLKLNARWNRRGPALRAALTRAF